MDHPQYTNLRAALATLPDPRKARGKRYEWHLIVGVIVLAILSEQRSVAAITHWVHAHAASLRATFQPSCGRLPSDATIRRTLRGLDPAVLSRTLAALQPAVQPDQPAAPPRLHGCAIDGKFVRGAGKHGRTTLLVSLVDHTTAQVYAQTTITDKRHESRAIPDLLADRSVQDWVVTLDAGLTHPQLAQRILDQDGHYLMVVKGNQRQLHDELAGFFETAPLPCDRPWREVRTVDKGHGRLETRQLTCTDDLDGYVRWPGVQQVLRRTCERVDLKTGEVSQSVTYGLTSVPTGAATAAELEALWRGHWTIEIGRAHV